MKIIIWTDKYDAIYFKDLGYIHYVLIALIRDFIALIRIYINKDRLSIYKFWNCLSELW